MMGKLIVGIGAALALLLVVSTAQAATSSYYSGSGAGYAIQAGGGITYRYSQATLTANDHVCGGNAGVGLGAGSHPIGVGTAPQVGSGENYPASYAFAGITCSAGVYTAYYQWQDVDGTSGSGMFSIGTITLRDKIYLNVFSNGTYLITTAKDMTTGDSQTTSWPLDGTVFNSADVMYQFDAGSIQTPPTMPDYLGAVTGVKFTQRNGKSVFENARKVYMSTDGSPTGAVWVAPKLTSSTSFSLSTKTG
jgi:hypothetical protein